MSRRKVWLVGGLLLLVALVSVGVLGQEQGSKGLSIIVQQIQPSEGQGFQVDLQTNKGCGATYNIGETVILSIKSAQAGYLTIYDFAPNGTVTLLFPNYYHSDNRIEANTVYQIPGPQDVYKFKVNPPQGMDILKAIVTTKPGIAPAGKPDKSNPFAVMGQDPKAFAKSLSIVVAPQKQWGTATCIYYIGSNLGTIRVNSVPQGAEVYWDGAYYWQTPVTIYGQTAGPHTLVLKKEGYQDWSQQVIVVGGQITPVTATLQPIGMGWRNRPKALTMTGGVASVWATAFNANNANPIAGWYWLRDPAFQASFGWRFPINPGLLSASEAWLNLYALVTNSANGGPGYETTVQLTVVIRNVQGGVASQFVQQVHLVNPFRPKSPLNSNGKGYQAYGLLPLRLSGLPVGGSIEVVATRLPTSYDGIYQPHVAFNPDALVLRYR